MGSKPRNGETLLRPREREVLQAIAQGKAMKEIAHESLTSVETVRTHLRNAQKSLGASNRAHAVALALKRGEITL